MIEEYKDRLAAAMAHAVVTTTQLSKELGISYQAVKAVIDGKSRGFGIENNSRAARILGVSGDWLATGEGRMKDVADRVAKEIELDNNPEYPAIRKVKFKLSAGASGFGVDYEGEDHQPIVFGKYWYEVNKLRPEALFAVRVANGSMEPGLHNGDIVVVNTLSMQPKDGTVFAINYEGEMVIKRLIRDEGDWWLHSDNPDQVRYKRKRMHEDCFLIGEVIQKQSMKI